MEWQQLNQFIGRPVRVCLAGATAPVHYGVLSALSPAAGHVDLLNPPEQRLAGLLRTEILASEYLLSVTTMGESDWIDLRRVNLAACEQVQVIQRRQYPRAEIRLPVWVHVLAPGEDPAALPDQPLAEGPPHAHTQNLSAGGMALDSSVLLPAGARLLLAIQFNKGLCLTGLLATVTRSGLGAGGRWLAAVNLQQPSLEAQALLSQMVLGAHQAAPAEQRFGRVLWPGWHDPAAG